jgi:hypothetical protein
MLRCSRVEVVSPIQVRKSSGFEATRCFVYSDELSEI